MFSKLASEKLERSGKAGTQRAAILEYVRQHPGKTSAEIAVALGLERHAAASRLPEMRRDKLVENAPARICTVGQNLCMTWNVAGSGQEAIER